jgi:outer membrane lipoprotein-sorting protein
MFSLRHCGAFLWVVLCATVSSPTRVGAQSPASLPLPRILEQMQHHTQSQSEALKNYKAVRHYHAEYHGYATTIEGKMVVEVTFDASSGKTFRVVSETGSKLLCEKVLKRAVDSEREASKDRDSTALTPANYRFQLAGSENLNDRPAYILNVEPLKESKFLYRGKIWVDATDFAVSKIEVSPAKNPSFWISKTLIHFSSAKTGDFWLPQRSRSETKVRIGGSAILTIDYGTYEIGSNVPQRNATD